MYITIHSYENVDEHEVFVIAYTNSALVNARRH